MRVEEQSHSTRAEITVSVDVSSGRMNLRVSPQISNTLYVNNYQLMTRAFKCEVAECLQRSYHYQDHDSEIQYTLTANYRNANIIV